MNRLRSNINMTLNNKKAPTKTLENATKASVAGMADPQQTKKKRTALENISNASISSNQNSNNNSIQASKEHKKSRFNNQMLVGGLNSIGVGSKKIAAPSASSASEAKENIGFVQSNAKSCNKPAPLKVKNEITGSVPKNCEAVKCHQAPNVVKSDFEELNELFTVQKEQQSGLFSIKTETTVTEIHIERQMATTSISTPENDSKQVQEQVISSSSEVVVNNGPFESEFKFPTKTIDDWTDIDANDQDEFSASDYAANIFQYYREREETFAIDDYLKHQPQLNKQMRHLLVDWMVEVQQQLEFNHEVLYLSVKLLDLYLNSRRIEKEKLQLLGGAAMFIACKFEERIPPIIDDFIYVSDNAYDRKELIKMEIEILKTIRFDIGAPLSYTFLRRYSKCLRADMKFLTLARYILELSLQDYSFAYLSDSLKACAALYLGLKMALSREEKIKESLHKGELEEDIMQLLAVSTLNLNDVEWNPTLIHYTGAYVSDFFHLVPLMNNLVKTAAQSKYRTIFKKYSHQVFYEVAKIPPLTDAELDVLEKNVCNLTFAPSNKQ